MRSKASKRSWSIAPVSEGESGEDDKSKKRVRWESRPDDEEMGTVTASGDIDETGEEGSTTPDNEKVSLFLQRYTTS